MTATACLSAFELLDDVCATNHIAPGLPGVIFRLVDDLQAKGAPDEHVRIVEQISVAMIRLQYAARDVQEDRRSTLVEQLRSLKEQWLSFETPGPDTA